MWAAWGLSPKGLAAPGSLGPGRRRGPGPLPVPDHPVPWERFNDDTIRDDIAVVVPGCDDYNRVRAPDGFQLPHAPLDSREFPTSTGKASFSVNPLECATRATDTANHAQPRPVQHHDLRTRRPLPRRQGWPPGGVRQPGRHRIVRTHRRCPLRLDIRVRRDRRAHLQERRAKDFNVVAYSTPRGNAAACYPETNPLVPLDHTAAKSNTPVSKAIVIRLEAASGTEHWGHSPRERGPHPPEAQGDDKGTTQWGA